MMIAMNCFCNKDVKEQNIKLCLLLPEVLTQETSDRAESGFESGDYSFSTYAKFFEKNNIL